METTSTRCTAALGPSRSDRLLLGEMFDQETGVESGIRPWHHRFRKMHASFQRPVGARPNRRRRRRRTWTPESAFNAMPPAVLGSGERGNGRETDLNFERLLCNLGAVGSHGARYEGCRCRRLAKVEVLSPSMSWLIERPTAHPLPTPTQKNQRALDRGIGCTTGTHVPPGQGTYRVAPRTCNLCTPQRHCTTPPWLAFHPIRRSFQSLPATPPSADS